MHAVQPFNPFSAWRGGFDAGSNHHVKHADGLGFVGNGHLNEQLRSCVEWAGVNTLLDFNAKWIVVVQRRHRRRSPSSGDDLNIKLTPVK